MKAVFVFCTAVVAIAPAAVANAASANACDQIVQKINDSASAIAADTDAYSAHRANFVDLIFGDSRLIVPNARQIAEQEKADADPLKAGTPNKLASFKGLVTAAQAAGCLSSAELSAIVEPTIKLAKRVNFDQFPDELPIESSADRGPPEMPKN
jgi:hypothetical protein